MPTENLYLAGLRLFRQRGRNIKSVKPAGQIYITTKGWCFVKYYLPKDASFKAAKERSLIVPQNFLGKLDCTRLLTEEETVEWENHRSLIARETGRYEEQLE